MKKVKLNEVYIHYKGGLYMTLTTATDHQIRNKVSVIYLSLERGKANSRPLNWPGEDSWNDIVEWPDGRKRARFIPLSDLVNDPNGELDKLRAIWEQA